MSASNANMTAVKDREFHTLKHKLEQLKSPLLNDLMICLRELMKDYKHEVCDGLLLNSNMIQIKSYFNHTNKRQNKLLSVVC